MTTDPSQRVRGIWLGPSWRSGRLLPYLGGIGLALAVGCAPPEPPPQVPAGSDLAATAPTTTPAPATPAPATPPPRGAPGLVAYETLPAVLQAQLEMANSTLKSPGLAMGVQIGDSFRWVGAAGVRNTQSNEPMLPSDQFRIGSVSKNFIGTCVLQLIWEKKISVDDTLEKWLPKVFKNIDGTKITVKNLLQHTSGIPDYTHDEDTFMKVYRTPPGYTFNSPTEILAVADKMQAQEVAQKATIPIGEFSYSSTNYVLLAMIATKADGIANYDYPSMVKRRIFEPVGMADTSIPATGVQTIPDAQQHAYVNWQNFLGYNDNQCSALQPACHDVDTEFTKQDTSAPWSAGAIISTVADLTKYMSAEMRGKLLTPESLALQQTFISANDPNRPTLYVGLSVFRETGYNFVGHRGAISGFNSTMQYQKDKDTVIVVLSNRSALDGKGVESVPEAVFKAIFPDVTKAAPPPPPPGYPRRALRRRLVRRVISILQGY